MTQQEGFIVEGKEHLACHRKKSLYDFKQASRPSSTRLPELLVL
jgi:hypothetical protein